MILPTSSIFFLLAAPRRKLPSAGSAAAPAMPRASSVSSSLPSHSGMFTSSEFILCGHLNLTRDTIGECRFFLDDTQYPLEGTVEVGIIQFNFYKRNYNRLCGIQILRLKTNRFGFQFFQCSNSANVCNK